MLCGSKFVVARCQYTSLVEASDFKWLKLSVSLTERSSHMAISKKVINGKVAYEVFVKVRDNTGKQVGLRRSGIASDREAKRVEFELKNQLEGFRTKTPWTKWVGHFLERYRLEFRNSTYVNYKLNLEK